MSKEKGAKKSPVQGFELQRLERRPRAQKKGKVKHKAHVYAVTLIDQLLTMEHACWRSAYAVSPPPREPRRV